MEGYKRMAWTLGMVALWALLGALSQYQWDVFNIGTEEYKQIVIAIIAGVGMFISNWLAPFIKQYGLGSNTGE